MSNGSHGNMLKETIVSFKHKYTIGDFVYLINSNKIVKDVIKHIHIVTNDANYVPHSSYFVQYELVYLGILISEESCFDSLEHFAVKDLIKLNEGMKL